MLACEARWNQRHEVDMAARLHVCIIYLMKGPRRAISSNFVMCSTWFDPQGDCWKRNLLPSLPSSSVLLDCAREWTACAIVKRQNEVKSEFLNSARARHDDGEIRRKHRDFRR